MFSQIIHTIFLIYTILISARIFGSWIPEIATHPWMQIVAQFTDPYLNLFRSIIPPIGGVLDLSPILAFLFLKFLETFLKNIFQ